MCLLMVFRLSGSLLLLLRRIVEDLRDGYEPDSWLLPREKLVGKCLAFLDLDHESSLNSIALLHTYNNN